MFTGSCKAKDHLTINNILGIHNMIEMLIGAKYSKPVTQSSLKLKITPSSSSRNMNISGQGVVATVTFNVSKTQVLTFSTSNSSTISLEIPINASEIYLSLKKPAGSNAAGFIQTPENTLITEVLEWGDSHPDIRVSLSACRQLVKVPTVAPPWTNWRALFLSCSAFNQDINMWDTSHVVDMNQVFSGCTVFNQPLNTWNTSRVTSMQMLFASCEYFVQDISTWSVPEVTNMAYMFAWATRFNRNISNLTFPKVTVANRDSYDMAAPAWQAVNKPNFAIK